MNNEPTPQPVPTLGLPKPLPLTVPFTIRPNSLYGVHVKYWALAILLLSGSNIFMVFILPETGILLLLLPLVGIAALFVWIYVLHRRNSLTMTADSITLVKGQVKQVIPFTELGKVSWGHMYAGGRTYWELTVENKKGDVTWKLTPLFFWNTRQLRTVYTSTPKQYQGPEDVSPFKTQSS